MELKIYVLNAETKINAEKSCLLELTNEMKIKGNAKIDQKACDLLKKCLVSISPKFL